jgi:hypothetical protein
LAKTLPGQVVLKFSLLSSQVSRDTSTLVGHLDLDLLVVLDETSLLSLTLDAFILFLDPEPHSNPESDQED